MRRLQLCQRRCLDQKRRHVNVFFIRICFHGDVNNRETSDLFTGERSRGILRRGTAIENVVRRKLLSNRHNLLNRLEERRECGKQLCSIIIGTEGRV